MIIEWITAVLLVLGAFFMFLAGLGILRFPDVFTRMHAATKASSFGTGLMLIATIAYFQQFFILIESLLVIIFIFFTAPVASHMLGRAAYLLRVPIWSGTIIDQLQGKYDLHTHQLASEKKTINMEISAKDLKIKIIKKQKK
ncbi:MAG: monovalent cation/H(+) antiporter subunit G [bacterium]|nr:monovalent cation/H(+) antiporter subunit G [bacterium]